MNFEVNAIRILTSSFEIPCSIFIISFSFFPKHGLGKNVVPYQYSSRNIEQNINMVNKAKE